MLQRVREIEGAYRLKTEENQDHTAEFVQKKHLFITKDIEILSVKFQEKRKLNPRNS